MGSITKGDDDWTITIGKRSLTLASNNSAKWLVHPLLRRNPTIALDGYVMPPL